jgi:hypothetical protein
MAMLKRDLSQSPREARQVFNSAYQEDPVGLLSRSVERKETFRDSMMRYVGEVDDKTGETPFDWLLKQHDVRFTEDEFGEPTLAESFGDWSRATTLKQPRALLLNEAISDYYRSGVEAKRSIPLPSSLNRDVAVDQLTPSDPLNPYDDEMWIRDQLYAPIIDFRRIVGKMRSTRRDVVRQPKYTNTNESMQPTPEFVEPQYLDITYDANSYQFTSIGIGIRASYEFLNGGGARMDVIRDAVDRVAISHRIHLFEEIVKAIGAARPSTNIFPSTAAALDADNWLQFQKKFNEGYRMDILLADPTAITNFQKLIAGSTDTTMNYMNLIASGMFGMGNMPMSLNEAPIIPDYGWYAKLTGSNELPAGKYLAFDRMRSSCITFQRGNDQDEIKQQPETRSVTRYLNTNYVIFVPDPNGIWTYQAS